MFLKPIMLAGLGAAVIPLVLHLLSKARYRTVEWGAMMFLEPMRMRIASGTRLKQAVLLLLRTAFIALLAIALARPVLRAGTGASGEEARIHAIIVLDRSASMGFVENSRTRIAMAKQAAVNVLSNLRRGDEVSLILTGDPNDPGQVQPTSDLQSVATRIGFVQPSWGQANFAEAIDQVRQALAREPSVTHEVYIVCDRQSLSWAGVNDRVAQEWQKTRQELSAPLRVFLLPIGSDRDDNVALESIRMPGPPAVRGIPAKVQVQVHNFGPIPRSDLPLIILADGDEIAHVPISLAPNSSITQTVWVKFAKSGSQVLSARISSNGLRSDDQIDTAINVLEPARVLVITGEPRIAGTRTSADFVRLALAPHEASGQTVGEPGTDPASVRIISADDWWGISPDRDDVVILTNIGQLSDDQTRQIEQFIYGGGGVIFAPGNLTDVESADDQLYREGEGFLPGSIAGGTGMTDAKLSLEAASHPIFEFLRDQAEKPSVVVTRSLDLDDRANDARVIATYGNGKPFLIERPYGKGRVLMFTTSLGTQWNRIATTDLFLPLMQSAVRYLAGASLPDRNLKPFDPIEVSFDHTPTENVATITLPNGQVRHATAIQSGQRWTIHFNDTVQPGRYQLALGKSVTNYVVSVPREEANPAPLSSEKWAWLQSSLGLRVVDAPKRSPDGIDYLTAYGEGIIFAVDRGRRSSCAG